MHQEAELCLPAHSIVSPTPPPDGSEEDQKVDMMLNPLVGNDVALTPTADASTPIMMDAAATTPPAEVNRPGLRKRKNTSDHYLCDRVRRPHSHNQLDQPLEFLVNEDAETNAFNASRADISKPDDANIEQPLVDPSSILASPVTPAPSQHNDADYEFTQTNSADAALPVIQYQQPTSTLPPQSPQASPSQREQAQPMANATGSFHTTSRRGRRRFKAERTSTEATHAQSLSDWSPDAMANFFGESALLFTSPPGMLTSNDSSNSFKFSFSGRAPRNANFRCEFCGKKYINKAPLVTHRWEHHPSWLFGVKFGLPRRQQVQMMEAAQALINIKYYPSISHNLKTRQPIGSDISCTEEDVEEEDMDGNNEGNDAYCDIYPTTDY